MRRYLGLWKYFKFSGGKQQTLYWTLTILPFRRQSIAIFEIGNGKRAYPPSEPNDPLGQAVLYRRPGDLD
jgi:hypothetical protein